jgi:hypothetical protein
MQQMFDWLAMVALRPSPGRHLQTGPALVVADGATACRALRGF